MDPDLPPSDILGEALRDVPPFVPVPLDRARHDGWSAEQQRHFIVALEAMGSVGRAARAVGMGRVSAYQLRKRKGAESFAAAWDWALRQGRTQMLTVALERALNGVTTIRLLRGGAVDIENGPDMRLVQSALRERPTAQGRSEKRTK
jgi:hypothetical protein